LKLIIENRSDLPMDVCLDMARAVVKNGRISSNNKQYCYYTNFKIFDDVYGVSSFLNSKSDRLVVTKEVVSK